MKRFLQGLLMVSIVMDLSAVPRDPVLCEVTKKISLGSYKPSDLVSYKEIMVSRRIVPDLKKLLEAAHKAGLKLEVVSGYRSFERQVVLFDSYCEKERKKNPALTKSEAEEQANTYSARAGHSEHQLGTAVDILSAENGYQFSCDKTLKYVGWLEKNAPLYNFRVSYPENSTEYQYEPWHVRWFPKGYLPTQNSLKIKSKAAS
ncbi:M15 family metallopeptidase [Candidatus Dependentiae bacterium]|nr:M15 family metallopeptidase [Candidatus Dependentiae bacterium]